MEKMQCKVCGSTRIKQINDSLCECGVCGRQYSLEEAQQLLAEIAETLSPQQQAEKEAALQSAKQYMAAGDTESALQNYETVLKMEPENEEALQAAIQIFASDNARDENGDAQKEQPEEQPGDENAPEEPEGRPGDEKAQEETQGAKDGAGDGTEDGAEEGTEDGAGEGAKDGADADANNAKSGSEKAKKGKTKKTKEKGKTSKKTEKEEKKEKDHDTDHDRDLDIHRDHDIDIDRDRDIDIHRDIDIGKDKKVVIEKEKKVKEKGGKKAGRGKTAIIIIIVAAVCVIAGIIIGVAVSHSSSSAEEETTVFAEVGATEAEEETEAAVPEPTESSESDESTASETEETTTAETAGDTEGTTAAAGMITGMSAAEFADYLQNEAGLDIFEMGGEPEVSDEVTLYYYGANIHIEKSKSVKAHDSSVMLYIYESNDTGQVIILRVYAYENDLESGLDAINDTLILPVSEAFSTLDLKTYGNEKGQEDYETFRTELNETFKNSAFDGKAYNVADLTFVFEEQEDIAAITLCNMYDLAALYNN